MRNKHLKLAASFFAVLTALVVSGISVASADDNNKKEVVAKPGETVEVEDGDTLVVDTSVAKDKTTAPKAKEVKANNVVNEDAKPASSKEPVVKSVMDDDFTSKGAATEDPVDTDSVVELALRGVLTPSGPAIGVTLGFSYRPINRVRLYAGFNAGKGLLELKGEEKELLQLGFTAGVSRVITRTVEAGLFGTMSWSYRDLVKEVSASFVGAGPGFRLNKAGGLIFFEAGIPVGMNKKFATGQWEFKTALQASFGFHF